MNKCEWKTDKVEIIELNVADLIKNENRKDYQIAEGLKASGIDIETDGKIVFYRVVYEDGSYGLDRLVKNVDPEDQEALALAKSVLMKKYRISSEQLV